MGSIVSVTADPSRQTTSACPGQLQRRSDSPLSHYRLRDHVYAGIVISCGSPSVKNLIDMAAARVDSLINLVTAQLRRLANGVTRRERFVMAVAPERSSSGEFNAWLTAVGSRVRGPTLVHARCCQRHLRRGGRKRLRLGHRSGFRIRPARRSRSWRAGLPH